MVALLHADPMAADRMLTRFAELLRVILHDQEEEHALEHEVDLLARYVDLMQLRFGDRISVGHGAPHHQRSPAAVVCGTVLAGARAAARGRLTRTGHLAVS
jgi:LytS/YehU family sensor histidine kinase